MSQPLVECCGHCFCGPRERFGHDESCCFSLCESYIEPASDIPEHLQDFPTDSLGRVVTYTGVWSSELDSPYVAPEPLLDGQPAIFSRGGRGVGLPVPTLPEPSRARRSVLLGLCQVCGEHVGDGPRWLGDLRIGWQTLRVDGKEIPLIVDSWTCVECLPYAVAVCPGLKRRPGWQLLQVEEWITVPTPERPKGMSAVQLPYGPVGFVKIAPTKYTVHHPSSLAVLV